MELIRLTKHDLDLSSTAEVLSYLYTDDTPREVYIRVDLGDNLRPIAGTGKYRLTVFVNDVIISPSSDVLVDAGVTRTIVSTKAPALLNPGDLLSVRVSGLSADAAVNVTTSVRDATPAKVSDLVGDGSVSVDHDYGGADALTVMTKAGLRIDNAVILTFRREDYEAGKRNNAFIVGQTTTDVNGRWRAPIRLDPGSYMLEVYKQGTIQTVLLPLTVT